MYPLRDIAVVRLLVVVCTFLRSGFFFIYDDEWFISFRRLLTTFSVRLMVGSTPAMLRLLVTVSHHGRRPARRGCGVRKVPKIGYVNVYEVASR